MHTGRFACIADWRLAHRPNMVVPYRPRAQILTHSGRAAWASKHCKALRRYQREVECGRAKTALDQFEYLDIVPIGDYMQWSPRRIGERDRLMMMGFFFVRSGGGGGGGGGGSGEFGDYTPTVQVDAVAEIISELSGASAGTIIGGLAGVYHRDTSGSVYRSNVPAFQPGTDGSLASPIILVGQYDPTDMASPFTDANRFELSAGSGAYDGTDSHPCVGANARDYFYTINVVVDEGNCVTKSDNGPGFIADCTGSGLERCVIRGSTNAGLWGDNHNCVRIGVADSAITIDPFVKGCILSDITTPTNSNAAVVMMYGAQNFLIEDTTIRDCRSAAYVKGSNDPGTNYNYGVFRRVWFEDFEFIRLQELQSGQNTTFTHCVFKSFTNSALMLTDFGTLHNNVQVLNCTFVADTAVTNGAVFVEYATPTGLSVQDTIFYAGGASRISINANAMTSSFGTMDNNQYYNSAGYTNFWYHDGTGYSDHGTWASAITETNSATGDPGFVNLAGSDLTLTVANGRGAYPTGSETVGA